jgi:hypothetical protein
MIDSCNQDIAIGKVFLRQHLATAYGYSAHTACVASSVDGPAASTLVQVPVVLRTSELAMAI